MTDAEITYDQDSYALTAEGQAYKLYQEGKEPVTDTDREWFATFRAEDQQAAIFAEMEAEALRVDQEDRGIPWADGPDRGYDGPGTGPQAGPEAEA
jgi:hypothetical protein